MSNRNYSPGCPDCGAARSSAECGSLDANGNRIRLRQCRACGHYFTSLEITVPFSFSRADSLKHDRNRARVPRRAGRDFFTVERQSARQWSIKLHVGRDSNRCRKGLHVLAGDNVYVSPSGQRVCKPCRRETSRKAYRNRMAKMPPALRDELREYRRIESAERLEYKREWIRRKRAERRAA